jgi:4-diphosphocytidyl-2-C-methyl-D-erythritol kinase
MMTARPRLSRRRLLAATALLPAAPALAALLTPEEAGAREQPVRELDVPFVPTPMEVVDAMLDMAKVTKDDRVYDLGCGDGRIVIRAAQRFGARGVGVDLNPQRVGEARAAAKKAGPQVDRLVSFDDVPAAERQPQAAPAHLQGTEAGHADRVARLRHGRLGAAGKARVEQRDRLLLDGAGHGAGPPEALSPVRRVHACEPPRRRRRDDPHRVKHPRLFLGLPAPAKLNLFLHVTGQRADGYHELQSVFVPVSLADTLDFESRTDGVIERTGDVIGAPERDLCVRAAQLLRERAGTALGVSIHVDKAIPPGSGMGGGSSDAATTLIALNRLWGLGCSRAQLAELAVELGADVPFFLGAGPAFVEGIGERLSPVAVQPAWYAVIHPQVHVSTAEIFTDPGLTRDTKLTTIAAFSAAQDVSSATLQKGLKRLPASPDRQRALFGTNDLQAVAMRRAPEVRAAVEHLSCFGNARMTGSGSAVFAPFDSEVQAREAIVALPAGWSGWAVQGLDEHPLAAW